MEKVFAASSPVAIGNEFETVTSPSHPLLEVARAMGMPVGRKKFVATGRDAMNALIAHCVHRYRNSVTLNAARLCIAYWFANDAGSAVGSESA